jgi:hypothetical protein
MMGVKYHNSCKDLFKRLEILTFPYEYIFSLIKFFSNNKEHFPTNAEVQVLTQDTSTISINQLLSEKRILCWDQNLQ